MPRSYESLSDNELVELARSGEDDAFAELWRRHVDAGRRYASSITRDVDSEDIVSEAFAKILSLIKRGKGPTNGFRSYLATAIRHTSETFGRSRRETPIDFVDDLADESTDDEHQQRTLDQSLTIAAFKSLPQRWQEALWYSEVEQLSVKECAALFGIKPAAMAMLTFRAREGLREAWIQAHIAETPEESEHRWVIERLGAYARNKLPRVQHQLVEEHLRACERCSIVAEEARYVGSQLALALLVPIIGLGAATAYFASIGQGSAAVAGAEVTMGEVAAPSQGTARLARISPKAAAAVTIGAAALIAVGVLASSVLEAPQRPRAGTGSATSQPAHDSSGTNRGAPLPGSSAPPAGSTDILTVTADTGDLHLFFPILSGHAAPGARIRVLQGSAVLADLTTPGDGAWSTSQLDVHGGGSLAVTGTVDFEVEERIVVVRIAAPALSARATSSGISVFVTGAPNAPFVLSSRAGAVAASTLGSTGTWSATYPSGSIDLATLAVRYQAGDRFGPSERR